MPTGDSARSGTAAGRLRQRWLLPSPPLAVDDEPEPRRESRPVLLEPEGETIVLDGEAEGIAAARATT